MSRRARLVLVAIACAVAAGVLGSAWALQAAVLPAPEPGRLVAARTMSWLTGDRLVESTVVTGESRRMRSTCVQTWLPLADGSVEPAVRLETAGRADVVPVGRPFLTVRGRQGQRPQGVVLARLALAGCPPVLQSLIGNLIKHRSTLPVVRDRVGGHPALALRVGTKAGRITVYVASDSMRPLAVAVDGAELAGRARLRLTRAPSPGSGPSGEGL